MNLKPAALFMLLVFASVTLTLAQAPKTLTYQGYLKNGGTPVTGTHNLTFAIYNASTGGTQLWTETINTVTITNGNFSVILGKTTPVNVTITTTVYLEITIADLSVTIAPRVELTGTLYSIASSGWSLTGNSGTVDGTNFIGTTDNVPLNFRVNSNPAGKLDPVLENTFIGQFAGVNATTGNNNEGFGYHALLANTQGAANTAIGFQAQESNTLGSGNVSVGRQTLQSNVAGNGATAIGVGAMKYTNDTSTPFTNTNVAVGQMALHGSLTPSANTGLANTAIGYQSMQNNSSGGDNTATGYAALLNNTTGAQNTAIGSGALYTNTNGVSNSAIGVNALQFNTTGNGNTALGVLSLNQNQTGQENSALGVSALQANTTGNFNTANGKSALQSNTIGAENSALGVNALLSNTTGTQNTAVGKDALVSNTSGQNNVAIGQKAMLFNVSGVDNTSVGTQSLYNSTGSNNVAVGTISLSSNTIGANNTAVGQASLVTLTTGSYNTAIGQGADVTANGISFSTAIGYGAQVNASNKVRIGNAAITVIEGQVSFTAASDKRLKKDIQDISLGLEFIKKLKPVSYVLKKGDGRQNWGFIAQDIESLVGTDKAVLTIGGDSTRSLGLRYTDFIAPLTKAVQELAKENETLKAQLKSRDNDFAAITAELEKIKKALGLEAKK